MSSIDVETLLTLVHQAGEAIMEVYSQDFEVQTKGDDSPLTQADLAAHRILESGLRQLTPELPVFSEEGVAPDFAERRKWARYWLIDPLDAEFRTKCKQVVYMDAVSIP